MAEKTTGDRSGYRSMNFGRQDDLRGSAFKRIADAHDTNVASKIDNAKWYDAIIKNCKRFNLIHGRLIKD
jgi:hypothetical protein